MTLYSLLLALLCGDNLHEIYNSKTSKFAASNIKFFFNQRYLLIPPIHRHPPLPQQPLHRIHPILHRRLPRPRLHPEPPLLQNPQIRLHPTRFPRSTRRIRKHPNPRIPLIQPIRQLIRRRILKLNLIKKMHPITIHPKHLRPHRPRATPKPTTLKITIHPPHSVQSDQRAMLAWCVIKLLYFH